MAKEQLFAELRQALSECRVKDIIGIFQAYHDALTIDNLEEMFEQYSGLIQYFKFNLNTESDKENFEKFLIAALKPGVRAEGDSYSEIFFKVNPLDKQYCKDHSHAFTREVYLSVKQSLLNNPESLHAYLEFFLPNLVENDVAEILGSVDSMGYSIGRAIIRELLELERVPEEQLVSCIKKIGFPYLSEAFRNRHAVEGVTISPFNLKHISEDNRKKVKDLINLNEAPMLVAYHPDRTDLSIEAWLGLILKDKRVLRFLPRQYLLNTSIFTEEFLLKLLIDNQTMSRARYKLISFIHEKAPERISTTLVGKIRELKLSEANHQLIVNA